MWRLSTGKYYTKGRKTSKKRLKYPKLVIQALVEVLYREIDVLENKSCYHVILVVTLKL